MNTQSQSATPQENGVLTFNNVLAFQKANTSEKEF
jgi:hypothetical protein